MSAFDFTTALCPVRIRLSMAGKITINTERCKGCGLCVKVCPNSCIIISKQSNKNGFFPAESANGNCTGCAVCAIICPETIIKVHRNTDTAEIGKSKPRLSKGKK